MRGMAIVIGGVLVVACGGGGGDPDEDGGRARIDSGPPADSGTPIPGADSGPTSSGGHYFPAGAFFTQDVYDAPAAADSATIIGALDDAGGFGGGHFQIDFSIDVLTAGADVPRMSFMQTGDFYDPDCDPVAVPIVPGGNVEGEDGYECTMDGDCHLIVHVPSANRLYEMWRANIVDGTLYGGCLAVWDTSRVYPVEGRGDQCSSADAAGFPIAPLLFNADEIAAGSIDHAIRFILPNDRVRMRTYAPPATHGTNTTGGPDLPPYGVHFRLRRDFDLASLPNEPARVVARALQRYGMYHADGGTIALTAQSDRHTAHSWAEVGLEPRDLDAIDVTDFEVIDHGDPVPVTYDCTRTPLTD